MAKLSVSKRERVLLLVSLVTFVVIILYRLGSGPLQTYQDAKSELHEARQSLQTAQQIRRGVISSRASQPDLAGKLAARPASFDLNGLIRAGCQKEGIQLDPQSVKDVGAGRQNPMPEFQQVEVSLRGVSVTQLVGLFHHVLQDQNMAALYDVQYLRAASDGLGLDCVMRFIAPRPGAFKTA